MPSAQHDERNGQQPPDNGGHPHHVVTTSHSTAVKSAIALADVYRGNGTTYLHIDDPLLSSPSSPSSSSSSSKATMDDHAMAYNPTGAVVPAISLATTFRQSTPGMPTARHDPNSFGAGYEYSRTGE
jgi:hypothetical protein